MEFNVNVDHMFDTKVLILLIYLQTLKLKECVFYTYRFFLKLNTKMVSMPESVVQLIAHFSFVRYKKKEEEKKETIASESESIS